MIEDDDDRAIFLSDFNEPDADVIRVTPADGEPFDLPLAIFDLRPKVENPDYRGSDNSYRSAPISGAHPVMRCLASEFPKSLVGQCTVRVRDHDYGAFDLKPDGTGFVIVELRRK